MHFPAHDIPEDTPPVPGAGGYEIGAGLGVVVPWEADRTAARTGFRLRHRHLLEGVNETLERITLDIMAEQGITEGAIAAEMERLVEGA